MLALKTILHPTDFSDLSKKVLAAALARAKARDAGLILLHVCEPQEVIEGEFGMLPPDAEPSDEVVFADLQSLLPANPDVEVEMMVAHGLVADEILRVANDRHCELIMLASHGHDGFFSRLFHANIAEQVKNQAPCQALALTEQDVAETAIA
jgi:nucleotide-binding universal stress UspA family protein